jgi:hypothetical protein
LSTSLLLWERVPGADSAIRLLFFTPLMCKHIRPGYYAFVDVTFSETLLQKEEWELHKLECQAISALTEDRRKMLTPTIRLMVRLILKRKLQREKVLASLVDSM